METLSVAWNRENGTVLRDTNNTPTYWSSASHTQSIRQTNWLKQSLITVESHLTIIGLKNSLGPCMPRCDASDT
jgi:hypothetical protein